MNNDAEIKEAEVVTETALATRDAQAKALGVNERDMPILKVVEQMNDLDWRAMKPHQMAVLLMSKPYSVRGGGTTFLTFRQALFFATRCFELGVSPFGDEVFFDAAKFSVNLTLSGKKAVARNKGIDLGPPTFEELTREWKDVPRMTQVGLEAQRLGFTRDVGCKCTMRVGDPARNEQGNYTAWLSEWMVVSSPVWKEKTYHMLQTRATEKCISLLLGTGASSMVGDEPD